MLSLLCGPPCEGEVPGGRGSGSELGVVWFVALETHRSGLLSQSHCSPVKAFMLSETQCPSLLQMRVIVLPCSPEGDVGGSCEWGHRRRTIRGTLEGSG